MPSNPERAAIPAGTVQAWAHRYVTSTSLPDKLDPAPPPALWAEGLPPLRLAAPGRPSALRVVERTRRSEPLSRLRHPQVRARLLHSFLHHELQAAELMCWAVLAFPDTPRAFRRGLVAICRDEVRHMRQYAAQLARHGTAFGDFEVRDWFWHRVPQCLTPLQFVSLLGIGLEGGNLDHCQRFAAAFAAAGDGDAAAMIRQVGVEEERHVRFAALWFRRLTGCAEVDYQRWRRELPPPLSPALMRGDPVAGAERVRAGLPPAFVRALEER